MWRVVLAAVWILALGIVGWGLVDTGIFVDHAPNPKDQAIGTTLVTLGSLLLVTALIFTLATLVWPRSVRKDSAG